MNLCWFRRFNSLPLHVGNFELVRSLHEHLRVVTIGTLISTIRGDFLTLWGKLWTVKIVLEPKTGPGFLEGVVDESPELISGLDATFDVNAAEDSEDKVSISDVDEEIDGEIGNTIR